MHIQDSRTLVYQLLSNPVFQQIAPLVVLLLIPLLLLIAAQALRGNSSQLLSMVFQNLGLNLPWAWANEHGVSSLGHERRKGKKKHVRSRGELVTNGSAKHDDGLDDGYYPGLVNVSGTYCFMNSTLQAMASLSYLEPHIEEIHTRAEELDVPTPVIDALRDILHVLNTAKSSPSSLRPTEIIGALSNRDDGKQSPLFSSREHQDAQELFQLISESTKTEAAAIEKESSRDRGLGGFVQVLEGANRDAMGKGVFDGLTANRRSCVECGYTEAVMHFAFDNWQLSMPRMTASCRLEDCIADYTRLELLTDCVCRKCSILATHHRLAQEAEKLAEATTPDHNPSLSKKKKAREGRKLEARVKAAIDAGRIEEEIKGVKMERVFSKASTKQAMIARPPRVLVLHLNRSIHYGNYAGKNTCRVLFPELLDLTPFTTSGKLSTMPSVPISSPPPAIPRSRTPTPATYGTPRTLYRLAAVVCHYGQHSFGHYVCFRRRPPLSPPTLACPLECECDSCTLYGHVRSTDGSDAPRGSGRGWLRVSDDAVCECGIERVLEEGQGAFMLYYERVVQPRPGPYPLGNSPRSSEETVRPEGLHLNGNASSASVDTLDSLRSEASGSGLAVAMKKERTVGPRIVRSVAAGRARSQSITPSDRTSAVPSSEGDLTPKAEEPISSHNEASLNNEPLALPEAAIVVSKPIPNGVSTPISPVSSASSLSSSPPSSISVSFDRRSTPPPSPSSPSRQPRLRIKSPQPLRPPTSRPISPARLVGLRA